VVDPKFDLSSFHKNNKRTSEYLKFRYFLLPEVSDNQMSDSDVIAVTSCFAPQVI